MEFKKTNKKHISLFICLFFAYLVDRFSLKILFSLRFVYYKCSAKYEDVALYVGEGAVRHICMALFNLTL